MAVERPWRVLRWLTLVAFLGYGWFLIRHACFAVGGSDSAGYANVARALLGGRLVEPIEGLVRFDLPDSLANVFLPLGYVRGPRHRTMAPLYPVGFPLHLAAAASLGGSQIAPYLVSPIAALLALVLTYLVCRELGLSEGPALGGALLLAACPVFVFQAIQPMSDVVATVWCLAAILAALRSRNRPTWALAAGLCFGVAVLVRPLDALLAVPLLFALRLDARSLCLFALGGVPCAAVQLAFDTICYGSPWRTGYGSIGLWSSIAWSNFPPRLLHYSQWIGQILTPLVPLGWLLTLVNRRIAWRDRALLLSWFAVFFLFYCFYQFADAWWYTRYLLPGIPALVVGFARALSDVTGWASARSPRWRGRLVTVFAVVIVLIACVGFRNMDRWGVLGMKRSQAAYPNSCRWVAATLPPKSLVVSMATSGALRYYTGLIPVRWDALDPEKFRDLRRRTEAAGYRWFGLLMSEEVSAAASRVAGRWVYVGERDSVSLWRLEPESR